MVLSFIQLIAISSKPSESELIYDPVSRSVAEFKSESGGQVADEVLIYRFNSALLFYNSGYFTEKLYNRVASKPKLQLIVIDAEPINMIDLTAATELGATVEDLAGQGIRVVFARANANFRSSISVHLPADILAADVFYPSIHSVFEEIEL